MSLFGRKEKRVLRQLEEQRALTSIPGYWPDSGLSGQAAASASRALSLVPVFGAVRLLADSIASLTPVLYTRDSNGIPRRQPTPSLFAQPSIHGTLYDWLFRAVVSMALQGDAIGLITATDYYNYPTMIEWLNPEQVATQDGKLYGPGSYMNPMWWWWGRPIDPDNLLHIPWFSLPYRVRGLSPIGAYQLTTNIGIGALEFQNSWFGQGGVPPGTFKNSNKAVDEKDADKITARLTSRLQTRKPLVFGSDWDYTPIAIKPNEAQFIETMQMSATHIAVIYGLPASRLGGTVGGSMTYSTVELEGIDYLTFSLRPWLRRFEYALTRCFPRGYFVKFDISDMLLLDAKTRADVDSTSLGFQQPGWKDRNEVRATYDLVPQKLPQPSVAKPVGLPQDSDDDDNGHGTNGTNGNNGNNGKTLNGTGNKQDSNGHGTVSGTNQTLSGTRGSPVNGRQAYIDIMGMRDRWENVEQ